MFSGKTSQLLVRYQAALKSRKKALLIKALVDNRYANNYVSTHANKSGFQTRIQATHVVSRLQEVTPEQNMTVFIDEIHLFPDSIATLSKWQNNGVEIVAATLNLDSNGQDFFQHKLINQGIQVCTEYFKGACAYPGCTAESTVSARIRPVGTDWVGGMESYSPCCMEHCALLDVCQNPSVLTAKGIWETYGYTIMKNFSWTSKQAAEAVNAAVVALTWRHLLQPLACPSCLQPHVDTGRFAEVAHHRHICLNTLCQDASSHNPAMFVFQQYSVGNPLALCDARLCPQSGKLLLNSLPYNWRDRLIFPRKC